MQRDQKEPPEMQGEMQRARCHSWRPREERISRRASISAERERSGKMRNEKRLLNLAMWSRE